MSIISTASSSRMSLRPATWANGNEVEGLDPVFGERGEILVGVSAREDGGMDAGVEGLDAAAEHLRHVGQLVHRRDVEAELGDVTGCASARYELEAELGEPCGELVEPGLVEDRDQRPPHHEARSVRPQPDRA